MADRDRLIEERRAASARLHDQVGQLLTATLINIEVGWPASADEVGIRDEVLRDLREALAQVRDLSLALGSDAPTVE